MTSITMEDDEAAELELQEILIKWTDPENVLRAQATTIQQWDLSPETFIGSKVDSFITLQGPLLPFDDLDPKDCVTLFTLATSPNQILHGKYLLCQTISSAIQRKGIEVVVSDPSGDFAMRLDLFNYSCCEKPATGLNFDEMLPPGMFVVLKNPWFNTASRELFVLRCNNPAEVELVSRKRMEAKFPSLVWSTSIQQLTMHFFQVRHFWSNLNGGKAAFVKLKWLGNKGFLDKRFSDAIRFYNLSLDYCEEKSGNEAVILSNKAAALLNIGCFNAALKCVNAALEIQPENEKAIYRKTKALIGNIKYEDALKFLEEKFSHISALSQNKDCNALLETVRFLFSRKDLGPTTTQLVSFHFRSFTDLEKFPEFFGPMTISKIRGKGRGLIATEDIHPGQVLICSKAFGHYTAPTDGAIDSHTRYHKELVIGKIANKLHFDPELGPALYKLNGGSDILHLEPGDWKNGHVEMARIATIVNINSFGAREKMKDSTKMDCTGLWILPSFFNHSCSEYNCIWRTYGEVVIIRAISEVKKGKELIIPYISPTFTLEERQDIRNCYEFVCSCKLCQLDASESVSVKTERQKILEFLIKLNGSSSQAQFKEGVRQVEKLYFLRKDNIGLNFALISDEVYCLAENLFLTERFDDCISVLMRMFAMANGSVLWHDDGIKIAAYLIRCHVVKVDKSMVDRWVAITKELLLKFYKTLEPFRTIDNLIESIKCLQEIFGIDFFQD